MHVQCHANAMHKCYFVCFQIPKARASKETGVLDLKSRRFALKRKINNKTKCRTNMIRTTPYKIINNKSFFLTLNHNLI